MVVTGSIWAKHEWFVWGTWSARLTTSLALCLLYVAYLLIRNYLEDPERRAMVSAVFGIIAFADTPLVWFSIRWWRDIHLVYLLRRRFYLESMCEELEDILRRAV